MIVDELVPHQIMLYTWGRALAAEGTYFRAWKNPTSLRCQVRIKQSKRVLGCQKNASPWQLYPWPPNVRKMPSWLSANVA